MCVCVSVCVSVCALLCVRLHVCVRVSLHGLARTLMWASHAGVVRNCRGRVGGSLGAVAGLQ